MDLTDGSVPPDDGPDVRDCPDVGDLVDVEDVQEQWPLVLVPEPPPWPRSFGWLAQVGEHAVRAVWFPGEPADSELSMLAQLSPRIEVELVRVDAIGGAGGELDVLVGERRLPGVLGRAEHGWTATLLVPSEQVDGRGDLTVTVRGAGVPVPTQLRLEVRPIGPVLSGRESIRNRMQASA